MRTCLAITATTARHALGAALLVLVPATAPGAILSDGVADDPVATREFEVIDDRPHLGGEPVELWGIRCGNALHSDLVTERHVRALDNLVAHGINLIAVYIQGSNGGYPDSAAGANGFDRGGHLSGGTGRRLEWLVREADARGMVVLVGVCSPRKDQEFADDAAIQRGMEEIGTFLESRRLRNVFVDLMHEYSHSRVDQDIFREPDGRRKKARLAGWFDAVAPGIEVGVCPYVKAETDHVFEGMDIRMIQKEMAIPSEGYVVNVETQKRDSYENDGVFTPGGIATVIATCERFAAEPRATLVFHAGYIQGISNGSGTGPHPEKGGHGSGVGDRGVAFYFDWVRSHVGRWEYPRHVAAEPMTPESAETREFEVIEGVPHLGGAPVELWGLRCHNALVSPAVTERLINNLDHFAEHGINLVGLCLQGTNAGYRDKDAAPSAFASSGTIVPAFADRLECIVRAADARGMVVCLTLFSPRRDQDLRDEAAVRRAVTEAGRFLDDRGLRNVFVDIFHEFGHPLRIDHDVFEGPDDDAKKQRVSRWFADAAPGIEYGICPNHVSGSPSAYSGAQVLFFHEDAPVPDAGFAVNVEPQARELSGNEGNFTRFDREALARECARYLGERRTAFLFQSAFVESIGGRLGTGPNYAVGGGGTGTSDRGIRPYYDWLAANVGPWRYPEHGPPR